MENLKIRVNNEAESKEVQDLFFELGYEKGVCSTGGYPALIIATPESRFQKTPYSSRATSLNHEAHSQYKEITLPDLRDLVVLKRNDAGDATHKGSITDNVYYVSSDEEVYRFESSAWCFSTVIFADLKPIGEKEMKEYLRKNSNGTYSYIGPVHTDHVHDLMIEIPEGANFAWKSDGKYVFFTALEMGYRDASVIWSRHTHPEELPFIDDEPKITTAKGSELDYIAKIHDMRDRYNGESDEDYRYQLEHYISRKEPSLNDQYAEIEKVRQSAWQKQEGGSHYKNLKIQPMQYALENKLDYAQANVVKYVTRHKEKNGKEDLLKAIHNIELMIEFYYGDEK